MSHFHLVFPSRHDRHTLCIQAVDIGIAMGKGRRGTDVDKEAAADRR
eukprot:CAMPEP_0202018752 /NCGR_PEP_ID=MMETSP0905-20130828/40284_1 /ASSEMBLY_ACC=CAM_ASM_000554 /TAXON_ID=420261 /ORGANISM="Thalassiosira antarctica, Strain CCMP982" /LENGTH=46 /DNA_ID= /DNA_START= /DNA_END= /DNA_ORIENTATION=